MVIMRLIGLGDSVTAGVFLRPEDTFLYLLGQGYRMDIVNAGVPGNTSAQGLGRMKEDVLARSPDVCTVLFGMNDHVAVGPNRPTVPVNEFRSNLERIVQALSSNRCVPILCTVHSIIEGTDASYYYHRHPQAWYESPSGAQAWIDQYNEAVRQVAIKTNTRLADAAARWECELHSGTRLADLLRTKENSGEDDGTHPTAWGHRIYADCIADHLAELLKLK
ncbi:SGNH/GDSL hydrolase family protein [Paenibacillus dendritiformis]|nr:SGNH/GDSL hydrolase family protein [Paenibacillus dendritiformis]CAH8769131.1 SGNH/GDSL hydrolase family protein [Paenibacillus dendritiformis]